MTSLTSLSQPELDVMLHLAQSKTTNVVVLAADMWRTTPDWQAMDPYPLITYVLDSLSSRGLCTYRLREPGENRAAFDLPFDIRLTPKGWELMGYGNKTVEVGTPSRHDRQPLHPGDMTDYLNLHYTAAGGPIETDTFAEHRARYPRHAHMYGVELTMANQSVSAKRTARLADPSVLQDPNGIGERGYVRVTPEMEARVVATREMTPGVGYADIAEIAGLPERTVKYILTDLPRLRRAGQGEEAAAKSLKERTFGVVEAIGVVKDVGELRRILGMADTEHAVMHVLHSLHTQGRIDFDERGNGMGTATVVNIRLPKKGPGPRGHEKVTPVVETQPEILPLPVISREQEEQAISARQAGFEATTPETPITTPSAPEPDHEEYPLLDALLDRERTRLDSDSKGMAYVTAAEAIEKIDPEAAATLMKKAEGLNVPFPSPIESEYIKYVAAHPKENA